MNKHDLIDRTRSIAAHFRRMTYNLSSRLRHRGFEAMRAIALPTRRGALLSLILGIAFALLLVRFGVSSALKLALFDPAFRGQAEVGRFPIVGDGTRPGDLELVVNEEVWPDGRSIARRIPDTDTQDDKAVISHAVRISVVQIQPPAKAGAAPDKKEGVLLELTDESQCGRRELRMEVALFDAEGRLHPVTDWSKDFPLGNDPVLARIQPGILGLPSFSEPLKPNVVAGYLMSPQFGEKLTRLFAAGDTSKETPRIAHTRLMKIAMPRVTATLKSAVATIGRAHVPLTVILLFSGVYEVGMIGLVFAACMHILADAAARARGWIGAETGIFAAWEIARSYVHVVVSLAMVATLLGIILGAASGDMMSVLSFALGTTCIGATVGAVYAYAEFIARIRRSSDETAPPGHAIPAPPEPAAQLTRLENQVIAAIWQSLVDAPRAPVVSVNKTVLSTRSGLNGKLVSVIRSSPWLIVLRGLKPKKEGVVELRPGKIDRAKHTENQLRSTLEQLAEKQIWVEISRRKLKARKLDHGIDILRQLRLVIDVVTRPGRSTLVRLSDMNQASHFERSVV